MWSDSSCLNELGKDVIESNYIALLVNHSTICFLFSASQGSYLLIQICVDSALRCADAYDSFEAPNLTFVSRCSIA